MIMMIIVTIIIMMVMVTTMTMMVFRKWKVLQSVQDRNETLFYRFFPIIPNYSTGGCPILQGISLIIVIQIVDGQLLRDGSDHLHPDSGLGLQSLLAPLQKVQRSDMSVTAF